MVNGVPGEHNSTGVCIWGTLRGSLSIIAEFIDMYGIFNAYPEIKVDREKSWTAKAPILHCSVAVSVSVVAIR